jgi:hypothetical protein
MEVAKYRIDRETNTGFGLAWLCIAALPVEKVVDC